jgi:sensor histidine kinase regulating citrate/malate metabolism
MKITKSDRLIFVIAVMMTVAYTILAIYVVGQEFEHVVITFEDELTNIASIIATDDTITTKLANEDISLDSEVEDYYLDVPELSFIIVFDMDSAIYSHPTESLIGTTYNEGDETGALQGDSYFSRFDTSLGDSISIFIPIYDGTTQAGVVNVGIMYDAVQEVKSEKAFTILLGFGIGLVVSLFGLWWLSNRFRSDLFGFTPSEIAILYAENKSVIEQLNEGVISVDIDYKITTINETLKKLFNLSDLEIGKNVIEVFPYVDFENIIENDMHIIKKYRKINDLKLLMNSFPLYLDGNIIGATATFRSHLEVDALLDQVNGYRQIATALRSQKHEFLNKLHVVLGLIKMKDYLKAESYITENVYTTNLASDYYSSRIKDDRILALFVGKEMQSKEYNASLLLTSDSFLSKSHHPISSDDIVIVLGNLVDNSFEAYVNKDNEIKRIVVDIFEDEDVVKLTVVDQAGGIDSNIIDKIFQRGISSKNGDSRGTGLSLVNEIVLFYNGEKNVSSSIEETKIEIILSKVMK